MLHLEIEGLDDVATYEWRALASKVGWTKEKTARLLPGAVVRPLAPAGGQTAPPRLLPWRGGGLSAPTS